MSNHGEISWWRRGETNGAFWVDLGQVSSGLKRGEKEEKVEVEERCHTYTQARSYDYASVIF